MPVQRDLAAINPVTQRTGTRQIGDGGRIHLKLLYRTIDPLHPDIQHPGDAVAELLDPEWPGSHLGFVDNAPLLTHHYLGVGLGYSHHFGSITTQIGGQHAVIGDEGCPGKAKAIEQRVATVQLANQQL